MELDDDTYALLSWGPGGWERMLARRDLLHELRRQTTQEALTPTEVKKRAEMRKKKHNKRKRKRSAAYMERKRKRDAARIAKKRRAQREGKS